MNEDLIARVRSFEIDHAPDGWPAIRMRDISALADALEEAERKLAIAREALHFAVTMPRSFEANRRAAQALEQIS